MFEQILFPESNQLHVENWGLEDRSTLAINISSRKTAVQCPACGYFSDHVHSHYQRTLTDLPSTGYAVHLYWIVRRFFCSHAGCPKITFTEQIPEVAQRYARKTNRLRELARQFVFLFGGEPAKRALALLNVHMSGDSLLNLVKQTPETEYPVPRVLGVDDWALRKGQQYGTILIDLERHRPIDLLPDREPHTLSNWLKLHPGVEIITRDRGKMYIEGATQGAPDAIQVADRFHILLNLQETLKRLFERHPKEIHQAKQQLERMIAEDPKEIPPPGDPITPNPTSPKQVVTPRESSHRMDRFQVVKDLQKQGWSQRAIARKVGIDRRTVGKYFVLEQPPRKVVRPQNQSSLLSFLPYLEKRWQEGCHMRTQLLTEIQEQGYRGSYASLWRAIARFPLEPGTTAATSQVVYHWSSSQAAWLLMAKEDQLSEKNQQARSALLAASRSASQAIPLVKSFQTMVRERKAKNFDRWLQQADASELVEFQRFARSLRQDYQAVYCGLSEKWSNGQTEGQVNRLKLVKRTMYGWASFPLLKHRFLGC